MKPVHYCSAVLIIHEPLIWLIKRIRLIKEVHTLNHSFTLWSISLHSISHLTSIFILYAQPAHLSLTPANPGLLTNSHNKALPVWIYVCVKYGWTPSPHTHTHTRSAADGCVIHQNVTGDIKGIDKLWLLYCLFIKDRVQNDPPLPHPLSNNTAEGISQKLLESAW